MQKGKYNIVDYDKNHGITIEFQISDKQSMFKVSYCGCWHFGCLDQQKVSLVPTDEWPFLFCFVLLPHQQLTTKGLQLFFSLQEDIVFFSENGGWLRLFAWAYIHLYTWPERSGGILRSEVVALRTEKRKIVGSTGSCRKIRRRQSGKRKKRRGKHRI